jgi:hypothetical protein
VTYVRAGHLFDGTTMKHDAVGGRKIQEVDRRRGRHRAPAATYLQHAEVSASSLRK